MYKFLQRIDNVDGIEEQQDIDEELGDDTIDYGDDNDAANEPDSEQLIPLGYRRTARLRSDRYGDKQLAETEANRILRVKKTQVEMIMDRGYDVGDDIQYLNMSVSEFYDKFKDFSNRELFTSLSKVYDNKVVVFYPIPTNKQLSASDLITILDMIETKKSTLKRYIIISENNASSDLRKQIANIESRNMYGMIANSIRIEVFIYDSLSFNPSRHVLVPKHVILSDEEKEILLKQIRVEDLPIIDEGEVMCRYLGAERDQIIKIYRTDIDPYSDNIIGNSVEYRIVKPDVA